MMYFGTEELWFPEWEHGGPYWARASGGTREAQSGSASSNRWKTPMLVIHGALDFRVPETQGLGCFHGPSAPGGAQRASSTFQTRTIGYLRPANSIFWHETVLDWLEAVDAGETE